MMEENKCLRTLKPDALSVETEIVKTVVLTTILYYLCFQFSYIKQNNNPV